MIFQGTVEERKSKFPHFETLLSLTCLDTNALNIYSLLLNFIILPFTADTAKELPPEKKATERFRIWPSLHNVSLVISMDSINKQKSSFTS